MKVGIDIDGVLYPWTDCANEALVAKFGIVNPGPHHGWDWLKQNITKEQWSWLWTDEGTNECFRHGTRAYPDVVEAFNAILADGHEVHFVTHRDPRRTGIQTALFLSYHFGGHPWAGLHVITDKTAKHTLGTWDVFVDDKPETVEEMLLWTGAKVFAPARPWNAELDHVHTPRFVRYGSPWEVAEWVCSR
jgi:hypothetical protein